MVTGCKLWAGRKALGRNGRPQSYWTVKQKSLINFCDGSRCKITAIGYAFVPSKSHSLATVGKGFIYLGMRGSGNGCCTAAITPADVAIAPWE